MKNEKFFRLSFSVLVVIMFAAMALACRSTYNIMGWEQDDQITEDEINIIMANESVDRNEAYRMREEGYMPIHSMMNEEGISYEEAKDRYDKQKQEADRLYEENEWKEYEVNEYWNLKAEGVETNEARRMAAILTYMERYGVSWEEAEKALGLEEPTEESSSSETTTEESTEASTEETISRTSCVVSDKSI